VSEVNTLRILIRHTFLFGEVYFEASNGHPSPINRPLGAGFWLWVKSSSFDFVRGLRRIRFRSGRVCRSFESGGSVECVLSVEQLEWSKHGFRLTIWARSMFALLRNRGSRKDFKWVAVILLNHGSFNLSVGESVTAIWTGHNPPRHDRRFYGRQKALQIRGMP
jgi:hypothetical protein